MRLFVLALLMSVGLSFGAQAHYPCTVDDSGHFSCTGCPLGWMPFGGECLPPQNSMKAKMNRANAQKAQPHAPANPHPNARMHR